MNAREKAEILRFYENYCYQISMYLLGNEELACESIKKTFLLLAIDPLFFNEPHVAQKAQAKRYIINTSLQLLNK
ncbi:hypothetical protein BK138_35125 [Paenibacillus rhizosphaerae]|uniref:RNA polymerase sigma-70 region 2 domain-containing protein n=1 Tax=Paenibacillus rhizosphaerae TaxID=297318 RepID=A0A1R1DWP2_9BACL|nr:hypothetical protein BK138_35125 [Paenibacillus rhizosphaerae]